MVNNALIQAHNASLTLGNQTIWSGVNFSIERGEFVLVTGDNGAGKTSLLQCLLGSLKPTHGSISIAGKTVPTFRRPKVKIGYVSQISPELPSVPITGYEMVTLSYQGQLPWKPKDCSAIDKAIKAVNAQSFANRKITTLSGGQFQRIKIASALVNQPEIVLCDEPLANLDEESQYSLGLTLNQCHRKTGNTIVLVTHELNPVLKFATRIIELKEGRLIEKQLSDIAA